MTVAGMAHTVDTSLMITSCSSLFSSVVYLIAGQEQEVSAVCLQNKDEYMG